MDLLKSVCYTVNFKSEYFAAASTSPQPGSEHPTQVTGCISWRLGPATTSPSCLSWLWPRDIQTRQWNPLSLSPVYSTLTVNKGACLEVLLHFLFHPPPSPPAWLSQPPWLFHHWPPGGVPGLCLCRTRDYNKLFFWPSLVSGWTWHTMSWQIQNSCKFKMFRKSFRILNT